MSTKWMPNFVRALWAFYHIFQCHAEGDVTERSERDTENGTFSSIPYGREPHTTKIYTKRTDVPEQSERDTENLRFSSGNPDRIFWMKLPNIIDS